VAIDIEEAFELPEHGILLSDNNGRIFWIGSGAGVPSHEAPVGSRYFRANGDEWKQAGPGLDDWQLVDQLGNNDEDWFTHYISFSPSRALREFGKSAEGFNIGYDIKLLELHVNFFAEYDSLMKLRVSVYRYDAAAETDRLILQVNQQGVPTRNEYYSIKDTTPDETHYQLDASEGDTFWVAIDDGTGEKAFKVRELTISLKYKRV
jgi:hypothetical protein